MDRFEWFQFNLIIYCTTKIVQMNEWMASRKCYAAFSAIQENENSDWRALN